MSLQVSYPEPPFSEKFRVNKKTAHAIRVSGLFLFTLPVILRSVNRIVTAIRLGTGMGISWKSFHW